MRRLLIGVSMLGAGVLFLSESRAGLSQFYGENWFRYTQEVYSDTTQKSEFEAKRVYFRYKHYHSDEMESRVTLEFFSDDGYPDGAGIKLKDAYVSFKRFIPEGDIAVGLQKQYFGRVYDWEYWPIVKAMGEKYKVIGGSRDYGISVGGYIPQGYGTWRLQVTNGEGYKKVGGDINTELGYLANLRFIPVPGVTIGGSFIMENKGSDPYEKRLYYAGLARYAKGPVDIWAQYLGGQEGNPDDPCSKMGFMIFPKFHLGWLLDHDMELFGRLDYWDGDTDLDDDGEFLYVGGFNYFFSRMEKGKPGVMLQAAFVREQPEAEDAEPTDAIMMQLRWHWTTPKW